MNMCIPFTLGIRDSDRRKKKGRLKGIIRICKDYAEYERVK